MFVLDNTDLIQVVATTWKLIRQLVIGQVKTIDILQDQQTLSIDHDNRRKSETASLFLRHDPQETCSKEEHKCQPAVICDAPDLHRQTDIHMMTQHKIISNQFTVFTFKMKQLQPLFDHCKLCNLL